MNKPPGPVKEDQQLASYIAMVIRNAMEDFHCEHLTDDQMKELNPIVRNAVCTQQSRLEVVQTLHKLSTPPLSTSSRPTPRPKPRRRRRLSPEQKARLAAASAPYRFTPGAQSPENALKSPNSPQPDSELVSDGVASLGV